MHKGKAHTTIRGFYFLYFAAIGCTFPYLNLYYEGIGLTGVQIGLLAAIATLVISLVSPLWGILGDYFNAHRALLALTVGGSILPAFLLSAGDTLSWLVPVTFVYAFFFAPIGPIIDSTALEAAEAGQRSYGELRVWGTIGFIVSAWLIGGIIERTNLTMLFYGYVLFMLGSLVLSLCLPPSRRQWRVPMARGLRILVSDPAFLLFLAGAFILSAAIQAADSFFALYLSAIGAGAGLVGLALAVASLSEVPIVFLSGALLSRFSAAGLLIFASVVFIARWLLYSLITSPEAVLAIQCLHGLSYGAFLVAGVVYTHEHAPDGLSATAQSLFSGATIGVAGTMGALIGGWLYDVLGVANLFRLCSLAGALALVLFLLLPRRRSQGLQTQGGA